LWLIPVFGFLLQLLGTLLSESMQAIFQFYIVPSSNFTAFSPILRITSVITMVFNILGYMLLFIALFAKRNTENS
jgi:hypothetical protein